MWLIAIDEKTQCGGCPTDWFVSFFSCKNMTWSIVAKIIELKSLLNESHSSTPWQVVGSLKQQGFTLKCKKPYFHVNEPSQLVSIRSMRKRPTYSACALTVKKCSTHGVLVSHSSRANKQQRSMHHATLDESEGNSHAAGWRTWPWNWNL